jgi:hypothetical protein
MRCTFSIYLIPLAALLFSCLNPAFDEREKGRIKEEEVKVKSERRFTLGERKSIVSLEGSQVSHPRPADKRRVELYLEPQVSNV